jgi:hypothetical protein
MEDRFRSIGHVCCSSYSTRTDQGRLALRRTIGFLPQAWLIIQHDFALPSFCSPSSEKELLANLEDQQLNLVGLWLSYQSQKGDLFAPRSLLDFQRWHLGSVMPATPRMPLRPDSVLGSICRCLSIIGDHWYRKSDTSEAL